MNKAKWWDEYEIKARYIPTFISSVPLVHFLLLFLGPTFWQNLSANISWMLVANIGLSLMIMLALVQFQCGFSKHWVEEPIFGKGGVHFPSTNMLLFNSTLISTTRKEQVRKKIFDLFSMELSTKNDENKNPENARLKARDAVNRIRTVVGKGNMTLQYNIRYGFFRNFIGGVLWSVMGSLGAAVVYGLEHSWKPMLLFIAFFVVHILLFIFKKSILDKIAFAYADSLLNDFIDYRQGGN